MANAEFEPTPSEITPTHRYYSDLNYCSESYFDLTVAAEKLLVQSQVMTEDESTDWLYDDFIPTATAFERDPDLALEQFSLMPLRLLAPYVNESWSRSDLLDWYDESLGFIKLLNKDLHGKSCHPPREYMTSGLSCKQSPECPLLYSKAYLENEALSMDFDQPEYILDPINTSNVALLKVYLASKHGLTLKTEAEVISDRYMKGFEAASGIKTKSAQPEQES